MFFPILKYRTDGGTSVKGLFNFKEKNFKIGKKNLIGFDPLHMEFNDLKGVKLDYSYLSKTS